MSAEAADATTTRVREALAARTLALVGASEKGAWTRYVLRNVEPLGFGGRVHLVSRRGAPVFGQPAVTSCQHIEEPVDVALLAVPPESLAAALVDVAQAGIRTAVILAVGYGEDGPDGRRRQEEVVALASELDMLLFGPNCLGYVCLATGLPAWFGALPSRMRRGGVAIVSQSGATTVTIASLAARQNVGISHLVSTGNEAMIDVSHVLSALIEDDNVRVLCAFVESIRRPSAFLDLADAALRAQKPVVVLKTGASDFSVLSAIAHTGAIVGDDEVVDAAFRGAGVIRVRSVEEMIATAGLLGSTGVLPEGGLGIMTNSGGAAGVAADIAEAAGVLLPTPAESGRLLAGRVPLRNPLDLTGLVFGDVAILDEAMESFRDDPAIALCTYVQSMLPSPEAILGGPVFLEHIARGFEKMGKPTALVSASVEELPDQSVALLDEAGVSYTACAGVRDFIGAVGHAIRWSSRSRLHVRRRAVASAHEVVVNPEPRRGTWAEARTLKLLATHGVAVAPWGLARSADEAVDLAAALGGRVVVKVASDDLTHKTDVGGVVIGVAEPSEVRRAFEQVTAAGASVGARVDGAVVASMRPEGLDLIVGVVRDPAWGLTLAVGLGGVFVEVLDDKALRLLPVEPGDVTEMLSELRASPTLDRFRGGAVIDRSRLAETICAIGRLASALGDEIEVLEVNPLRVSTEGVEVLDALCVWRGGGTGTRSGTDAR